MPDSYAKKEEFDKLQAKVEKFVEYFNTLFTTKDLQQAVQTNILEKLEKIEKLLEKTQENLEKRIYSLEEERTKRLTEKDFKEKNSKRLNQFLITLCAIFGSIHLKDAIEWLSSVFK